MKKTIFQDVPLHQRGQVLWDNADKIEENATYIKSLNEDELNERRANLMGIFIFIDSIHGMIINLTYSHRISFTSNFH